MGHKQQRTHRSGQGFPARHSVGQKSTSENLNRKSKSVIRNGIIFPDGHQDYASLRKNYNYDAKLGTHLPHSEYPGIAKSIGAVYDNQANISGNYDLGRQDSAEK